MAVPASRTPRILVVRRDHIGDLVCTTPLLRALRERLPDSWIGALVITYNAEVLARNPDVDAVYAYEKMKHGANIVANLLGRLKLRRALRESRWDYALVPSPVPRTLKYVARLSPRWIITPSLHEGHEVERSFSLGEAFGLPGPPGPVRLVPDPEVQASLRERLGDEPLVAVHFSARRPAQRWPLERYAQLVREVQRTSRVFLLWSPGSRDHAQHPGDDEAASQLATTGAIAAPTPGLRSMIAALSLAKMVICPDGGGMHLAAGLGKPIVALFGDSPVERWRPWGVPHRIVRPDSGHLRDLPVAPVLDAYFDLAASISR